MPSDTTDQQITLPVDPDTADNPLAFTNFVADIEQRLVRIYTNEADRTARMLSLAENEISGLASENRIDAYNGTNHVSLWHRGLFAGPFLAADHLLAMSDTALQSVTGLVAAMPTAGTFGFRGVIFYDSSTTADIKFAFQIPAAATLLWNPLGIVTGGTTTGDGTFATASASDSSISIGGGGVGTVLCCQIEGSYIAGGTAGNLQFRAAQNTSDATQSTIRAGSRLEVWRQV